MNRFWISVMGLLSFVAFTTPAMAQCSSSAKANEAMKAESPKVVKVGDQAPEFTLKGVDGKEVSLASFKGKTVVLEWFNPGCPFVKRVHLENGPMPEMAKKHIAAGGVWLAINSGAPGNQGTGVEANQQAVKDYSIAWPLLIDETGEVGRKYDATKTPHVYVINGEGKLVYAGAVDSTKGGGYGEGEYTNYLQDALDAVAKGKDVASSSNPAWGCSVKYAR